MPVIYQGSVSSAPRTSTFSECISYMYLYTLHMRPYNVWNSVARKKKNLWTTFHLLFHHADSDRYLPSKITIVFHFFLSETSQSWFQSRPRAETFATQIQCQNNSKRKGTNAHKHENEHTHTNYICMNINCKYIPIGSESRESPATDWDDREKRRGESRKRSERKKKTREKRRATWRARQKMEKKNLRK